jgi:hypothetical protein
MGKVTFAWPGCLQPVWLGHDVITEDSHTQLRDWLIFPNQPLSRAQTHVDVHVKCPYCRIVTKIGMFSKTLQYLIQWKVFHWYSNFKCGQKDSQALSDIMDP